MTPFADLMTSANDAIVTFLADKMCSRIVGKAGATVGEPFPVIFNDPPAESFGMVSGTRPTIECAVATALQRGEALRIDATDYIVVDVDTDRGMLRAGLEIAE